MRSTRVGVARWCRRTGTRKKGARRFFTRALAGATSPAEVSTDRTPAYLRVLDELLPAAHHVTVPYANNGSRPTTAGSRRC
jgi:transposase-like protein